MSFLSTYSTNRDIQAHFPFTFSEISRPTKDAVEYYRVEVYGMINERMGGAQTDAGGLKRLEIRKVIQLIDNYYARGRGERTFPVYISDEDIATLRLNTSGVSSGYGGGGYMSTDIPK